MTENPKRSREKEVPKTTSLPPRWVLKLVRDSSGVSAENWYRLQEWLESEATPEQIIFALSTGRDANVHAIAAENLAGEKLRIVAEGLPKPFMQSFYSGVADKPEIRHIPAIWEDMKVYLTAMDGVKVLAWIDEEECKPFLEPIVQYGPDFLIGQILGARPEFIKYLDDEKIKTLLQSGAGSTRKNTILALGDKKEGFSAGNKEKRVSRG